MVLCARSTTWKTRLLINEQTVFYTRLHEKEGEKKTSVCVWIIGLFFSAVASCIFRCVKCCVMLCNIRASMRNFFFPAVISLFYFRRLLTSALVRATDCSSYVRRYTCARLFQMVRNFFRYAHVQRNTIFSIMDLVLKTSRQGYRLCDSVSIPTTPRAWQYSRRINYKLQSSTH